MLRRTSIGKQPFDGDAEKIGKKRQSQRSEHGDRDDQGPVVEVKAH